MTKHFCDFCGHEIWHKGHVFEDGVDIVDKDSRYHLRDAGWLITALRHYDRYPTVTLCNHCYTEGMKPVEAFLDRLERFATQTR